jgi:hypothetical protein
MEARPRANPIAGFTSSVAVDSARAFFVVRRPGLSSLEVVAGADTAGVAASLSTAAAVHSKNEGGGRATVVRQFQNTFQKTKRALALALALTSFDTRGTFSTNHSSLFLPLPWSLTITQEMEV